MKIRKVLFVSFALLLIVSSLFVSVAASGLDYGAGINPGTLPNVAPPSVDVQFGLYSYFPNSMNSDRDYVSSFVLDPGASPDFDTYENDSLVSFNNVQNYHTEFYPSDLPDGYYVIFDTTVDYTSIWSDELSRSDLTGKWKGNSEATFDLTAYSENIESYAAIEGVFITAPEFFAWTGEPYSSYSPEPYPENAPFLVQLPAAPFDPDSVSLTFSYAKFNNDNFAEMTEVTLTHDDLYNDYLDCYWVSVSDFFEDDFATVEYYYVRDFQFQAEFDNPTFNVFLNDCIIAYNYFFDLHYHYWSLGKIGVPIEDYVSWIATAISGFFDLQIFPGFQLSGILIMILGFSCVMWFLKIFAGG